MRENSEGRWGDLADSSLAKLDGHLEQAVIDWACSSLNSMLQELSGSKQALKPLGAWTRRLATVERQLRRLALYLRSPQVSSAVLQEAIVQVLRQANSDVSLAELRKLLRSRMGDVMETMPKRWLTDNLWHLALQGEVVYVRRKVYRLAESRPRANTGIRHADAVASLRHELAQRGKRPVNLLRLRRRMGLEERVFWGAIAELVASGEMCITSTSPDGFPWYGEPTDRLLERGE